MSKLRRDLYRAARLLGDLEAASRGPGALSRRMGRKFIWRLLASAVNQSARSQRRRKR